MRQEGFFSGSDSGQVFESSGVVPSEAFGVHSSGSVPNCTRLLWSLTRNWTEVSSSSFVKWDWSKCLPQKGLPGGADEVTPAKHVTVPSHRKFLTMVAILSGVKQKKKKKILKIPYTTFRKKMEGKRRMGGRGRKREREKMQDWKNIQSTILKRFLQQEF